MPINMLPRYLDVLFVISCILAVATTVLGHSWNDKFFAVSNPSAIGYPRMYLDGQDMTWRTTNADYSDSKPICQPSQQTAQYSPGFPMLSANPGDMVNTTYRENGHVALDRLDDSGSQIGEAAGGKAHPGQWYIYWTNDPTTQLQTMADVNNAQVLAGPINFDDGTCSEGEGSRPIKIPCMAQFQIPANTKSGIYQIVWFWRFPKATSPDYIEWYTSCADINVGRGGSIGNTVPTSPGNSVKPTIPVANFKAIAGSSNPDTVTVTAPPAAGTGPTVPAGAAICRRQRSDGASKRMIQKKRSLH